MAIQGDTNRYKKKKNASIFMFDGDDPEPRSLKEKRQMFFDTIFGQVQADEPADYTAKSTLPGERTESNTGEQAAKGGSPYEVPESVQSARANTLEAVEGQTLDAADYRQEAPDAPEFDRDQFKKAKNLSKVAFIAQGIDALTDAIGRARTDDTGNYQSAPARNDQLGFDAYQTLANLDVEHKQNLQRYQDEVFTTNNYNRQARQRIDEYNKGVDATLAEQELNFALQDEQAKAAAEKAKQEAQAQAQSADREAYIEAGNRLISQGQERAAMVAFNKAGLASDEIAGMLRVGKSGTKGAGNRETDPTIQNMVNRFNSLEDELGKGDYGPDGSPMTPKAKEYEYLKEELGRERYNPLYQTDNAGGGNAGEELISSQNKGFNRLNPEEVRRGLNSPESIMSANKEMAQSILDAENETQAKKRISAWVSSLKDQGFSEQEIEKVYAKLVTGKAPESEAVAGTTAPEQQPIVPGGEANNSQPSQEDSEDISVDTGKISDAIHSFGNWLTDEQRHEKYIAENPEEYKKKNRNAGYNSYKEWPFYRLGKWLKQTAAGNQVETLAYQALLKARKGEDYADINEKIKRYAADQGVELPDNYIKEYIADNK